MLRVTPPILCGSVFCFDTSAKRRRAFGHQGEPGRLAGDSSSVGGPSEVCSSSVHARPAFLAVGGGGFAFGEGAGAGDNEVAPGMSAEAAIGERPEELTLWRGLHQAVHDLGDGRVLFGSAPCGVGRADADFADALRASGLRLVFSWR